MAAKNTAGAAGQAAALPAAPEISLAGASSQAGALHDRMAYELLPALKVLQFAVNAHRVMSDIRDHARSYPEFSNAVSLACGSWRDPYAGNDVHDTLNDFTRVVVGMTERLVGDAEGLDCDIAQLSGRGAK